MRVRCSAATFAIAFCAAYLLGFAVNRPLFLYYPLHRELAWGGRAIKEAGPAMAWYGLMANAGIVAAVASLIIPGGGVARALRGYLWLFPCVTMVGCVFLLRKFFL